MLDVVNNLLKNANILYKRGPFIRVFAYHLALDNESLWILV